ncbi:MAG: hypothetical protein ACHBNF_10285 [Chromatiales bacterium]
MIRINRRTAVSSHDLMMVALAWECARLAAPTSIALPFHNRITEAQVDQVLTGLEEAVRRSNAA